jgi:hypothetical protein
MNNQDKVAEIKRIISTAQDDLALLMKKGKRFKPDVDEEWHVVNNLGEASYAVNNGRRYEEGCYEHFNCYETEELATKAAVMMHRNNAIIMACLQVDPDFVPDYLSDNQKHYSFYYEAPEIGLNGSWECSFSYTDNYGPCVSTVEKWKEAAALLKEWEVE